MLAILDEKMMKIDSNHIIGVEMHQKEGEYATLTLNILKPHPPVQSICVMYKDHIIFKGHLHNLSFQNDYRIDMCFISTPKESPIPLSEEELYMLYAHPSQQIFEKIDLRHMDASRAINITSVMDPRSLRVQTPKSALSSVHMNVHCHLKSMVQERLNIKKELKHLDIDWKSWRPPDEAPYRFDKGNLIFDAILQHKDTALLVLKNPYSKEGRIKTLNFDTTVDHVVGENFFETDEGRHVLKSAMRMGLCHLNASFRRHRIYVSIPWENGYCLQLHNTVTVHIPNFKKMMGQIVELRYSYTHSTHMCHMVIACFDDVPPLVIHNNDPTLTCVSAPVEASSPITIENIHHDDHMCHIRIKRHKALRERMWSGHVEVDNG